MPDALTPDAYALPGEVAALLRVSVATLAYWRRAGGGPPFVRLPNRKIRYRMREVLAWLEAHRQRTTSDLPRLSVVGERRHG